MVVASALPTSASTCQDSGKHLHYSLLLLDEGESFYDNPEPPNTLLDNLNKIVHLTKGKLFKIHMDDYK